MIKHRESFFSVTGCINDCKYRVRKLKEKICLLFGNGIKFIKLTPLMEVRLVDLLDADLY